MAHATCIGRFLVFLMLITAAVMPVRADTSAVILIYHRFGEQGLPQTNVTVEQFQAHVHELKTGGYTFLPLEEIVDKLARQEELPERTVAVTIDDAFASFRDNGWPLLRDAGIPATLFVSTDPVDAGGSNYMSWDDIRTLQQQGLVIGHHGASHMHMLHEGVAAAKADIEKASSRFREELGYVPKLFAYPYGEYNLDLIETVKSLGFKGAMAQYSSVASYAPGVFEIPRFPFNENYGDLARLKLIANAQALPVSDITPKDPALAKDRNPPLFGFTIDVPVQGIKNLACYPSHIGKQADLLMLNDGNRIEIRFEDPLPPGRHRINCTLPGPDRRWYWFGRNFFVPGGVLD